MMTDAVIRKPVTICEISQHIIRNHLSIMFAEWHVVYVPTHQLQDINCSSCRQAQYVKFWETDGG